MKTKTEKEVKAYNELAKHIAEEYSYLDTMPLEGWLWEFVRRSEAYKKEFIELEDAIKGCVKKNELFTIVERFSEQALKAGIAIPLRVYGQSAISSNHYIHIKFGPSILLKGSLIPNWLRPALDQFVHIPKPTARFVDLSTKPSFHIEANSLVRKQQFVSENGNVKEGDYAGPGFSIFSSLNELINDAVLRKDPDFHILGSGRRVPYVSEEKLLKYVLNADASKDVVYVAISRNAKYTQLKEHLLPSLKHYFCKEKPRKREKEWKYYLIVYDLRKEHGNTLSFGRVAEVLAKAYPDFKVNVTRGPRLKKDKEGSPKETRIFDARNCENYFDAACSLIAGDYKKYLLPTK